MPSNRSSKGQPVLGKKQAPPRRRTPTEVQPISPLGVLGAVLVAVAIAAVLLFVINTRISGSRPAAPTATPIALPTVAPLAAATAPQGVTQLGGFSKGNASAKVTVTEYADYK